MAKKCFSRLIRNKDCLYRYRAYNENSIKALKSNRLYFSSPQYFNDPYDNVVYVNSNELMMEIISNIYYGMEDYLDLVDVNGDNKWNEQDLAAAKKLWEKDDYKMHVLKEKEKELYAAIDTVRVGIRNNTKVICFSEEYNSMLMWSHYADYHKGFVLVYDKADLINADRYSETGDILTNKTVLSKVEYVDAQIDLTEQVKEYVRYNMTENMGDVEVYDASIPSSIIRKAILEKKKDWSYEKEWRLVCKCPKIEKESPIAYITCRPIAVIIGSQCIGDKRQEIIDICKANSIPVYAIYLMENDPTFRLEVNDEGNLELERHEYWYYYVGD